MKKLIDSWHSIASRLDGAGAWLAPLGLRLVLAWEFWEAGASKLRGSNWFASHQASFPFPLDRVPADLSWSLATWAELIGAVALLLGVATRFFAFVLLFLTAVAIAAVHWPAEWSSLAELARGYVISGEGHGNFKLPLIFAVMLLPLVFGGAGRLSVDAVIAALADARPEPVSDLVAWGLAAFVLGLPLLMLMPLAGAVFCVVGLILLASSRWLR